MLDLPTGTVTFLFTDIEGSTRLLESDPQAMGSAMTRHHVLLREAVEAHAGRVFETLGDGVYAAFSRASDALAAALQGQLRIQAEAWGTIGQIRVRMGLHTGDVVLQGEHYFGVALFRCARLMALGHGGQTLVSRTTCDLLGEALPPGATLRSLGTHRLKDLTEPSEVYQLMHAELPTNFPPLKSLNVLPNNLPIQPTRFIGRERDLTVLKDLVLHERVVTLFGSGGAGKTRLGLQLAADLVDVFPDGVWFVDFAPLVDPQLVAQTLAGVLSIREEPGRPVLSTCVDHLRTKRTLLLLDNCEHVAAASAALVHTLVRSTSQVHILTTSRAVLGVAGECTWRVPSLTSPPPPPPPLAQLTQYEAVRLFLDRAVAASFSFAITHQNAPAVAEICHRLDGIPLAIELSAARVRLMPVEQIAARLDDRLRFLTGGSRTAMPRQQTLRALIDWSHELLSEPERVLFRRLSVFAGGWTLESAEAVCTGDGLEPADVLDLLSQLIDKSLVVADEYATAGRYHLLESIRQFAYEKLVSAGEVEVVRPRHLDFFLSLAEQAKPEEFEPRLLGRMGQEFDNVRAALRWSIERNETERALRLAGGLWGFWFVRGCYTEGRAWLHAVLGLPAGERGGTAARARALQTASHLANCQGDSAAAAAFLDESRGIWEELGDQQGLAASLHLRANIGRARGDLELARPMYEEARALNRAAGNAVAETLNILQLADIAYQLGDNVQARMLASEAFSQSQARQHRWATARALHVRGQVALADGDRETARSLHDQSLAIQKELADQQGQSRSLAALARVALAWADLDQARLHYEASLRVARDSQEGLEIARSLEGLAELESRGDPERALRLVGAAGALRNTMGAELYPEERRRMDAWLNMVYASRGEKACAEARAAGRAMPLEQVIAYALEGGAPVALAVG